MFSGKTTRGYIPKEEHEEFVKRMEAEHKRLSHRIDIVEKLDEKIYQIIASIEKMSANVENMLKNQERQEKHIESHDLRIDKLESKNGKKWDDVTDHLWKVVVAAIGVYMLAKMGIG